MGKALTSALGVALICSGCASQQWVEYKVDSDPPGAAIEVNGVHLGRTPTTIRLGTVKRWVGVANSPDGWEYGPSQYEVKAYPPRGTGMTTQTKRITPAMTPDGATIFFDLNFEPVRPTQPIQVR